MNTRQNSTIKIMVAVTFAGMVTVNALANILPINGVGTGAVSDSYPNLFAPAGLTFAIWGLIYLLLAAYTLYQIGLFRGGGPAKEGLLRRVGILFSISSVANTAWIFSWHYRIIPLSMILMIVILVCLILINQTLRAEKLTVREKALIGLPFSVYFGWITVATIANMTVLLVSLGFTGFGVAESIWAVAVLIVGMLIGTVTMVRNRDIAYGVVLIWAYLGIYIKHVSEKGFGGQYPMVMFTAVSCLVVFALAVVYTLLHGKKTQMT